MQGSSDGYGDLISGVNDANTFAMRIGQRWATDLNYGKSLIKLMELYDLYRLDDMTLKDFSAMIGRFADPCPGAVVTSNFGFREFDNKFHKGLDLGTGSENIPTYAAESGTVIFAGYSGSAAVQQAVPQVIICISRSRRMVWLSIHCYILRATEQAVNCSVWTR